MRFLWPSMLWLQVALPLLAFAYLHAARRRAALLRRHAGLSIVDEALKGTHPGLRHGVAALLLAGVAAALFAAARPEARVTFPWQQQTVILAMDVSGSMRATDMYPDRLGVAQAAAKRFISAKPSRTRVGLVQFSSAALLAHTPTTAQDELPGVIDGMRATGATAIGDAILVSLKAALPHERFDDSTPRGPQGAVPERATAIILLTDGENTEGIHPLQAAQRAAEHGVRVFTIGLGTEEGDILPTGYPMDAGNALERVSLDEGALREVARLTGGEYYRAEDYVQLMDIYERLGAELVLGSRRVELTPAFCLLAAATLVLAALLSLARAGRIA